MDWIWDNVKVYIKEAGIRFIFALAVLIIGLWLSRILLKLIKKSRGFKKLEKSAADFLASFLSIALKTLVIITVVAILGVPMTSVVALLAAAGAAIGLALQGSLANLVGGFMILIFKPFSEGDYIETSESSGTVQAINVFYTVLVTIDNKRITIPNGNLANSSVTNCTVLQIRRLDIPFNVAYSSDMDKVRSLLLDCAKKEPLVLDEPESKVLMTAHSQSSLEFTLQAWCKSDDRITVKALLVESVKKEFDNNNIQIPFPQMDVHIKQ